MKKLILLSSMLISGLVSAQTYPYSENFEGMTSGSAPTGGWTTSGFTIMGTAGVPHGNSSIHACSVEMKSGHNVDTLITPLIGPLTASSVITLQYRFMQAALYPSSGYSLTPGDSISIDAYIGAPFNTWFNHQGSVATSTGATTFTTYTFTNSSASGFSVKIRLDITRTNGDWFLDIDNVSIKNAGSTFGVQYNVFNPPALVALPNPSEGNFAVWLKNYQATNTVELKLYNNMGQLVKTIKPDNVINNQFNVNTTDLAKGVYMVEVISGNEVSNTKVIVE
jgi:hypothetical protein